MVASTTRVGILLFDQFDLLDAGGPYEVFLTAGRLLEREGLANPFDVVLVSPNGGDVNAYGGMTLSGTHAAADAGDFDAVIVPGLIDVEAARQDPEIIKAVEVLASRAAITASVCTGAFLLNDAGLLDGKPATTHWEDVDMLVQQGRILDGVLGARWVDNGTVVTSAGLTSGLHMALHLVDRWYGQELAERTARQLDMDWDPDGKTQ